MTEAPYPKRGGRGRPEPLPPTMDGVRVQTVAPYGGLTYEEWIAQPLAHSEIKDTRPRSEPEVLGESILRLCKDGKMNASDAADMVLGT